jgi:Protein of unknown function (DUF4236)
MRLEQTVCVVRQGSRTAVQGKLSLYNNEDYRKATQIMGYFRFRRSIKLLPGIRWNIGKKSTSVSFGVRGLNYTLGTKGSRTTVGIPGTGISYTNVHTLKRGSAALPPAPPPVPSISPSTQTSSKGKPSHVFYMLGFVALSIWVVGRAFEQNLPKSSIAKTSQSNTATPVNPDRSQMETRRAVPVEPTAGPVELPALTQVPSTTPLVRTCRLVNVAARDSLKLRAGPGFKYPVVTKIPAGTRGITLGHKRVRNGGTIWQEASWDGHAGWVSENYIQVESAPESGKATSVPSPKHPEQEIRRAQPFATTGR